MKKILITGVGDTRNNGCWAMVRSVTLLISEINSDPVDFFILTHKLSEDQERFQDQNITFINQPWTFVTIPKLRFIWSVLCFVFIPAMAIVLKILKKKRASSAFWNHFLSCDLVLDLSGDSLSADYNNFSLATMALPLSVARILNKPYMLCAQSIGPFHRHLIHKIIVLILKDASIITTRERITDQVLSKLGIVDNVIPTQDLSFALKPASRERLLQICKTEHIDQGASWVGMSISGLISHYAFMELEPSQRKEAYLKSMANFADYIVTRHNKRILFVPHVVIPNENSDLKITSAVMKRMKHRHKAALLKNVYLGDELKAVIGICDVFVGSRMHATIAALSQGVPTLTYVYNHKTVGINGQILGQDRYLIDIRKLDRDALLEESKRVIGELLEKKETIQHQLNHLIPGIVPVAVQNAWLAIGLLESAGPLRSMQDPLLCTGCGSCVAACDFNALSMQATPQGTLRPRLVNFCRKCGNCCRVCPALGFDLSAHETDLFGRRAADPETGVVVSAHKGFAIDPNLRNKGSSGGLVTAITQYLLEKHQVDAVLVVRDTPNNPLSPIPIWAKNNEDVLSASGSKYTPVALMALLQKIPDNIENIAVVGLPCHLWGLKLLEASRVLKGKNLKYRLGLFCGKTPPTHSLNFILREMNVDKSKITRIQYRGDGWPSGLRIETNEGKHFISLEKYWRLMGGSYYYSKHCFLCPDFFAHLADISFGDAWLEECRHNKEGWSVCLGRSDAGHELLMELKANRILHLDTISVERIKEAMIGNIVKKYRQIKIKKSLFASQFRVKNIHDETHFGPKAIAEIKFKNILAGIGQSRIYEQVLLGFPPNLFMRVISKVERLLA